MPTLRRKIRIGLQTKVMVAVLTLLILLPGATLWVVDQRITARTRADAEEALLAARDFFLKSLDNRADALVARHRNLLNDSRFQRVISLGDDAATRFFLRDVLDELADDTEVLLFLGAGDGAVGVGARRDPAISIDALAQAAAGTIETAKRGGGAAALLCVGEKAFGVVALPVLKPEGTQAGILLAGIRLGEGALIALKPPRTDVLLIANDHVAASSLRSAKAEVAALALIAEPSGVPAMAAAVRLVLINDERFLALTGDYGRRHLGEGMHFVLFSSYEQRLHTLEDTRFTLIALSVLGILVSAMVVWFFIQRITLPLRQLRDSAEAVGRGDFTHRIERFSNDECGELAEEFNRMTAHLQTSRAELERAMQLLRDTQHQLVQSEKLSAVGQFVAGVAHELNNPLTSVVGFAELLQESVSDARTRTHLERIAQSAHLCHKIVQNLLSFARQHPPERALVEVHSVIETALEILAYELRTNNVKVVKHLAEHLPSIFGDMHQLQQVFINILGNARQAMEPSQREGRLTIRTRNLGPSVEIEFEDNGPGIRPEHLARIFDPFFTTKPVGQGTGLGLSLSYGIVKEHGGNIVARSEPGKGATFTISLPVATAEQLQGISPLLAGTTSPFPSAAEPAIRVVLVVDDERCILELAAEVLRTDGYEVETAESGEAALQLLSEKAFDLIVTDWKMPGLNGARLFEHVLADNPEAARRVLFMTGDVMSNVFQTFIKNRGLKYIAKPFAIEKFRAAVARLFAEG